MNTAQSKFYKKVFCIIFHLNTIAYLMLQNWVEIVVTKLYDAFFKINACYLKN